MDQRKDAPLIKWIYSMTPKQKLFIAEYLKCFNATQAAIAAGYSKKSARTIGHENLTKHDIAEAISQHLTAAAMGQDEVLMRLAAIARGNISEFINKGGGIDWTAVKKSGVIIKRIAHTFGKNSSIELYDAQTALTTIGKHHALFVERHEVTGKDGSPLFDLAAWNKQQDMIRDKAEDTLNEFDETPTD